MKQSIKIFVALVALALCGCTKEQEVSPYIEVTPNNIAGTWQLQSWSEGLDATTYVYITFDRAERTFVMYDNLSTDHAVCTTGRYNIYTDAHLGSIIRGEYDYGRGEWNDRYVIRELTESTMKWISKRSLEDDVEGEEVFIYTRAELPEALR